MPSEEPKVKDLKLQIVKNKKHIDRLERPYVFCSEAPHTHYSIKNATNLYNLKLCYIKATPTGEFDVDHFK